MSVITMRMHRRYAVRSAVQLRRPDGSEARGLLIELSGHGCRISSVCAGGSDEGLRGGERVEIWSDDGLELAGTVRWTRDRLAGIRLERVLDNRRLGAIVGALRGADEEDERRFGT